MSLLNKAAYNSGWATSGDIYHISIVSKHSQW